MKTAHRIRMNPTPEQVEYLKRACGTRRFLYNWGREQWEKQYQAYKQEQETVLQAQRVLKAPNALALKKHKFTTELARTCGAIGIEDLNLLGMMANRKLSRAVADAAMGQLLQFLKTKVANAAGDLFIASRWFPSTKRCSYCGHVKKRMPLKHRTYQCQACELVIDRDLNAAYNLAWFATDMLRQLHA